MTRAYYNEIDAYVAGWLRNLIADGLLPDGDVDERDIRDVRPDDLAGYTQCHFFAGIGGWPFALRLAGWPDDRPVWSGSCPCQPFSAAGRSGGFADERHLWPHWFHLIEISRPRVVFGEQVASKDGLGWLDLVQADMEGTGYAFGALDLCAAGFGETATVLGDDAPCLTCGQPFDDCECILPGPFLGEEQIVCGAPHIRQRLGFVAERMGDATISGRREEREDGRGRRTGDRPEGIDAGLGAGRGDCGMEHTGSERRERREAPAPGHDDDRQTSERTQGQHGPGQSMPHRVRPDAPGPTDGVWSDPDWLFCRDGKWRPVEPGTFPLDHGVSGRVGRLRAYGNAIVPQVWAEFVRSYMEREAA